MTRLAERFGIHPETELEKLTRLVAEAEAEVLKLRSQVLEAARVSPGSKLAAVKNDLSRAMTARDKAMKAWRKAGGR